MNTNKVNKFKYFKIESSDTLIVQDGQDCAPSTLHLWANTPGRAELFISHLEKENDLKGYTLLTPEEAIEMYGDDWVEIGVEND